MERWPEYTAQGLQGGNGKAHVRMLSDDPSLPTSSDCHDSFPARSIPRRAETFRAQRALQVYVTDNYRSSVVTSAAFSLDRSLVSRANAHDGESCLPWRGRRAWRPECLPRVRPLTRLQAPRKIPVTVTMMSETLAPGGPVG